MQSKNEIERKLVWSSQSNETDTASALHCYHAFPRQTEVERIIGGCHEGNSALCNARLGVSEDGDSFLSIDKVQPTPLNRLAACKRCLKIYDKLILKDQKK